MCTDRKVYGKRISLTASLDCRPWLTNGMSETPRPTLQADEPVRLISTAARSALHIAGALPCLGLDAPRRRRSAIPNPGHAGTTAETVRSPGRRGRAVPDYRPAPAPVKLQRHHHHHHHHHHNQEVNAM